MKASIENLIAANPSGLLELKPSMTINQYRESLYGFNLLKTFTIYKSSKIRYPEEEWFAFPNKSLKNLFTVEELSEGDLLVAFIIEIMKGDKIYCYLVLSDKAYQQILKDKSQHVLQVHQMYAKFFQENLVPKLSI